MPLRVKRQKQLFLFPLKDNHDRPNHSFNSLLLSNLLVLNFARLHVFGFLLYKKMFWRHKMGCLHHLFLLEAPMLQDKSGRYHPIFAIMQL